MSTKSKEPPIYNVLAPLAKELEVIARKVDMTNKSDKTNAKSEDLPQHCTIVNEGNIVGNQGNIVTQNGNTMVGVAEKVIDRLEDIGRMREKLENLLDMEIFKWGDKIPSPEFVDELKVLREKLVECWIISTHGEQ